MMSIWQLANIEQEKFAAVASLFAIHTQPKSVRTPPILTRNRDDDSSDEDDIADDWQTVLRCDRLSRTTGNILKDKFLDRLSEVLSREKGPKHVAAAAWIHPSHGSPTTILVSKNEGLDKHDSRMLARLQIWLRAVSKTGKVPGIGQDGIWNSAAGEEGLVKYYRNRLKYYASQISSFDMKALDAGTPIIGQLQHLHSLCSMLKDKPTVLRLSDAVNAAYELRYTTEWHRLDKIHTTDLWKPVLLLGRLRAAYEYFKRAALSFPDFESIELTSIVSPEPCNINRNRFRKQLQSLAEDMGRKRLMKKGYAQHCFNTSFLHVHAEIQILLDLESRSTRHYQAHHYIGASKKPCFLCHELLQNYSRLSMNAVRIPTFRARESHGKVYPLWTLPSITVAPNHDFGISLAAALRRVHQKMLQSLSAGSIALRPAIAESSAGMSGSATFAGTGLNTLKHKHLAHERDVNFSTPGQENDDDFGAMVSTAQVLQIPADGSRPKLVPITFHAIPPRSSARNPESGNIMPDFRPYWASCHCDRKLRQLDVENQPNIDIEGHYWIYRNGNAELPENAFVKKMLDIDHVDSSRHFYYGDMFMIKFTKSLKTSAYTVIDISSASLADSVAIFNLSLQKDWTGTTIENELRLDQKFGEFISKLDMDKAILYQRMSVVSNRLQLYYHN